MSARTALAEALAGASIDVDDTLLSALAAEVGARPESIAEAVELASVLGPEAALGALRAGELRLRAAEVDAAWSALEPAARSMLLQLALFGDFSREEAVAAFGATVTSGLVELLRAGWVLRDDSRFVLEPSALRWVRARAGAEDLVAFADAMEPVAAGAVDRFRLRRNRDPELDRLEGAFRRALEVRPSAGLVDAYDLSIGHRCYRDAELFASHLERLDRWVATLGEVPRFRLVRLRHMRRSPKLYDAVVEGLQPLLADLSGVEALEGRLLLSDALVRLNSWEDAVDVARGRAEPTEPDEHAAAIALDGQAGRVLLVGGRLDEADQLLTRSIKAAKARGMFHSQGIFQTNLAMLRIIQGQLAAARVLLDEADHSVTFGPQGRAMFRAIEIALARKADDGPRVLEIAAAYPSHEVAGVDATLFVYLAAAAVDPAWGARADALAAERGTAVHAALVEHVLRNGPAPSDFEAQHTLRMLDLPLGVPTLRIDPTGKGFELASGWVDLSRSEVASRLVAALATAAGPLDADALIEAGWPGQRIRPESAKNRLYVALNTLRKLGLKDWLVRNSGGYALRPGWTAAG